MILAAAWYHTILAFFFTVLAVLLIIVILLQRGKGVGLAGAFGGMGGATAFGAKTGDVLTWVTIIGAIVLLTYAVILNFVFVSTGPGLTPAGNVPGAAPVAPAPTGEEGAMYWESPGWRALGGSPCVFGTDMT